MIPPVSYLLLFSDQVFSFYRNKRKTWRGDLQAGQGEERSNGCHGI